MGALILRYMLWKADDVILPILSTLERTKTCTLGSVRIPCRMLVAGTARPCASDGEAGKLTCSDTPLRPHTYTHAPAHSFTDRPKGGTLVEGYVPSCLCLIGCLIGFSCFPTGTRAIEKKKVQNSPFQFGITVLCHFVFTVVRCCDSHED